MERAHVEALATVLAHLRQRQRISQELLARQSGVSRATISNIENGRDPTTGQPPRPKPDTLQSLAEGLAIDGAGDPIPGARERFYMMLMTAAGYWATDDTFDFQAALTRLEPTLPRHVDRARNGFSASPELVQRAIVAGIESQAALEQVVSPGRTNNGERAENGRRRTGT